MDDLISRQAAINTVLNIRGKCDTNDIDEYQDILVECFEELPTAEKMGKWIIHDDDLFPEESTMECDQCHEEQPVTCSNKFCPNCGARMEE